MSQPTDSSTTRNVAIVVGIILSIVAFYVGSKNFNNKASGEDTENIIKPVAHVEIVAAAPAAAGGAPKSGTEVYTATCAACHGIGAAGSPKFGDKAAWAPRIAQGKDVLYHSALNGKNAMPARGGNASLTDEEVKAAVDHMVGAAK